MSSRKAVCGVLKPKNLRFQFQLMHFLTKIFVIFILNFCKTLRIVASRGSYISVCGTIWRHILLWQIVTQRGDNKIKFYRPIFNYFTCKKNIVIHSKKHIAHLNNIACKKCATWRQVAQCVLVWRHVVPSGATFLMAKCVSKWRLVEKIINAFLSHIFLIFILIF